MLSSRKDNSRTVAYNAYKKARKAKGENHPQRIGSRAKVFHGTAFMTAGGLRKKDLKRKKVGERKDEAGNVIGHVYRIVSKRASAIATARYKQWKKDGAPTGKKGTFAIGKAELAKLRDSRKSSGGREKLKCVRRQARVHSGRRVPPMPAKDCVGKGEHIGMDGNAYKVKYFLKQTKTGKTREGYRWVLVDKDAPRRPQRGARRLRRVVGCTSKGRKLKKLPKHVPSIPARACKRGEVRKGVDGGKYKVKTRKIKKGKNKGSTQRYWSLVTTD